MFKKACFERLDLDISFEKKNRISSDLSRK